MTNRFVKIGLLSTASLLLVACGGGGGSNNNIDSVSSSTSTSKLIANAGSDLFEFGKNKITLDASASTGDIVSYTWSENNRVIGRGKKLNNIKFSDGVHTLTLTVKSKDNKVSTDTIKVTAECTMAKAVAISKDVNDTLSNQGSSENSICYSMDLNSNNSIEKYTYYINYYEGTVASRYWNSRTNDLNAVLKDEAGQTVKEFTTVRTEKNVFNYEQFEIPATKTYYLVLKRKSSEKDNNNNLVKLTAKYGFSIQPSNDNGLKHDKNGELNDFKSMATQISLATAEKDVNGTLNYDRARDSSIKNTDQTDYYEINFDKAGKFAFYMNFYKGTIASRYYNSRSGDANVELLDENDQSIKKFKTVRTLVDAFNYEQFEIPEVGKYYLKINRKYSEKDTNNNLVKLTAKYGFSIQPSNDNGLKHDKNGELNDFKSMATQISLATAEKDVNGTLNYDRARDSSIKNTDQTDYYEINFDKAGKFAFYMNFYKGTIASRYYNSRSGDANVELLDENDQSIKKFKTVRTLVDAFNYEQFEIPEPGKYYLKIHRIYGETFDDKFTKLTAKYGFSIQPSNDNGLKHNKNGELNDFKSMATEITLADISNEINGTLNYDRVLDSSIKNTDQTDYYKIHFDKTGTFHLNLNFYEGTVASVYYNSREGDVRLELIDSYNKVVKKFTTKRTISGASYSESFTIPEVGDYYLKLTRNYSELDAEKNFVKLVAKYGIKVTR